MINSERQTVCTLELDRGSFELRNCRNLATRVINLSDITSIVCSGLSDLVVIRKKEAEPKTILVSVYEHKSTTKRSLAKLVK